MTEFVITNSPDNQVLLVTADGEFQWHEDADRLIEEGGYTNSPALKFILRSLREWYREKNHK